VSISSSTDEEVSISIHQKNVVNSPSDEWAAPAPLTSAATITDVDTFISTWVQAGAGLKTELCKDESKRGK
jgi:hypothetical protein